jgi:hypothetical protein
MDADLDLVDQLRRFGAPAGGIVALSGPATPAHVPYLDLSGRARGSGLADAVVELERRPVIYVVRGHRTQAELERLVRVLAQRGQAEHLALLVPGQLHVFPLDVLGRTSEPLSVDAKADDAPLAISRIALGPSAHVSYNPSNLHDDLLRLLTGTIESIIETTGIEQQTALSWVGRALFFRFLVDREIVKPKHLAQVCDAPELVDAFVQPHWARQTSAWLDRVFNGDLLPLPNSGTMLEAEAEARLCKALSKILYRTDPTGAFIIPHVRSPNTSSRRPSTVGLTPTRPGYSTRPRAPGCFWLHACGRSWPNAGVKLASARHGPKSGGSSTSKSSASTRTRSPCGSRR